MTRITRRLTAKNRDQLRNPTLGNRVWATFTFTFYIMAIQIAVEQLTKLKYRTKITGNISKYKIHDTDVVLKMVSSSESLMPPGCRRLLYRGDS